MPAVKMCAKSFSVLFLLLSIGLFLGACSAEANSSNNDVSDGTYSAFVENVSEVSFEGNQMVVVGTFELDGKPLKESAFELELSDGCVYEYDWGGEPSGDVSEEVQTELSNLEFGSMAFDVEQGKVTRIKSGA